LKFIKKILLVLSSVLPGLIRIYFLKAIGFKVHNTARIGMFTLLIADKIEIGKYAKIGSLSIIKCDKNVILKDNTEISSFVLIYGENSLYMDSASYIGPKAMLNTSRDITIGFYSAIGPASLVYTHGVWHPYTDGYPRKFEPVTLKSFVWIPAKVFIGPGVTIGKHTIIASGENIFKNVPENVFYTGGKKPNLPIQFLISKEDRTTRIIHLLTDFLSKFNLDSSNKFMEVENLVFTYQFELEGKSNKFIIFGGEVDLKSLNTKGNKPNTILFIPQLKEKLLPDSYQAFCFHPIICSKPKSSMAKQLKSFFERECGLRFGINEPLQKYFKD
jgi:acetyltransferase-like isoleucine patch superfamily enzyme